MQYHTFNVSFRFRSHDADIYEVDGEAVASWDFADGKGVVPEGDVEIHSVSLTDADVDGGKLSWSALKNFEAKYADDYEADLWFIAKQSIDGTLD